MGLGLGKPLRQLGIDLRATKRPLGDHQARQATARRSAKYQRANVSGE